MKNPSLTANAIPIVETERLILRELLPEDAEGMFELDSDPEVHRFLGNKPLTSVEQSKETIEFVRKQYRENGIGRWAVVEKSTKTFLGWAGLKFVTEPMDGKVNYYDVGYRLIQKHWGKGFATEAALASVEFGFEKLNIEEMLANVHIDNAASRHVLEKCGMINGSTFLFEGETLVWYSIRRSKRIAPTVARN